MKTFKGKAIYNPSGKAGEYSYWGCNFHVGCSNGCTYCYCKKGILAGVMGQDRPQLKKFFEHETHALDIFHKELVQNLQELKEHGLFFSFTTDPMLPETIDLTWDAVGMAVYKKVPVKILTKCTWWVDDWLEDSKNFGGGVENPELYAFGFTLTGHDELEPGASTNQERIEAMEKLHNAGFKTFSSIEPIIDFESSYRMIEQTLNFCDLYKVGLMSGGKYDKKDAQWFMTKILIACSCNHTKVYIKDSLIKLTSVSREALCLNNASCVDRDYNIFNP
jgi:DNA repair photolyase